MMPSEHKTEYLMIKVFTGHSFAFILMQNHQLSKKVLFFRFDASLLFFLSFLDDLKINVSQSQTCDVLRGLDNSEFRKTRRQRQVQRNTAFASEL